MAVVELIQANNNYASKKFIADTEADIASLPTNVFAGSTCFCVENSEVYVINTEGTWSVI